MMMRMVLSVIGSALSHVAYSQQCKKPPGSSPDGPGKDGGAICRSLREGGGRLAHGILHRTAGRTAAARSATAQKAAQSVPVLARRALCPREDHQHGRRSDERQRRGERQPESNGRGKRYPPLRGGRVDRRLVM